MATRILTSANNMIGAKGTPPIVASVSVLTAFPLSGYHQNIVGKYEREP